MVILQQDLPQAGLQVGEIQHHSSFCLAFDDYLHLVSVTVEAATLGMARKEVGAIHEFYNAELHLAHLASLRGPLS